MKRLISIFMLMVMAIVPATEQAVTSLGRGTYNAVVSNDDQELLLDNELDDIVSVDNKQDKEEAEQNHVESGVYVEQAEDSTPVLESAVLSSVTEKTDAKKETNVTVETTQAVDVTNTVEETKKATEETAKDSTATVVKTAAKKETKKVKYTYKSKKATMYAKASVNVRSLPCTDGSKLGALTKNQEVKVTGVCKETGWYRISYKGKVGYVSNKYLVAKKQVVAAVKPTVTPKPTVAPTPTPTKAPEKAKYTYTDMKATMYAKSSVNVRDLPCTDGKKLGALSGSQAVTVTGQCKETKWYRITYNGKTAYVSNNYLVSTKPSASTSTGSTTVTNSTFPIKYSDSTCSITITKEWYQNAYCYAAHIVFSDYDRFGTSCGNGKFGGFETTSHANKRLGALLTVNGDYAAPKLGYRVARSGKVMKDGTTWCEGIYNNNNGILAYRDSLGVGGKTLSTLVANGKATDTFQFGPAFLINGSVSCGNSSERAQRTFIGTNGKAGDIWIVVSDGRKNDGKSAGLTYKQCANYLKSKGCTFGLPLDGGGSSTMVWKGKVLNAAKGRERAVVDFVYFK